MKFLIVVLTTAERTGWVEPRLSEYLSNVYFSGGEHQIAVRNAHNHMPAAAARNFLGEQMRKTAKEDRPDWLVMIDNDMVPYTDFLNTVKDAPSDADIVVPGFHMWHVEPSTQRISIKLCWGLPDDKASMVIDGPAFFPIVKCGTGAIFIKPHVFDKIDLPYFWYPLNPLQGIEGTEDITFCKKVLDAGLKMYGNSGVVVGHMKSVNLAEVSFMVEQAKRDVLAASPLEAAASPA